MSADRRSFSAWAAKAPRATASKARREPAAKKNRSMEFVVIVNVVRVPELLLELRNVLHKLGTSGKFDPSKTPVMLQLVEPVGFSVCAGVAVQLYSHIALLHDDLTIFFLLAQSVEQVDQRLARGQVFLRRSGGAHRFDLIDSEVLAQQYI